MKRFLIITGLFLLPIVAVIGYVLVYYKTDAGDLRRMSYLKINYDYKSIFEKYNDFEHLVISNDHPEISKRKWKYFTLGDSFFQQRNYGFVNFLTHRYPDSVVNFSRKYLVYDNPILTLEGLIKEDYFDSVDVNVVILETVERYAGLRANLHNPDVTYSFSEVEQKILEKQQNENKKVEEKEPFPTDRFVKFPANNIAYLVRNSGANNDVYLAKLNQSFFSTSKNQLLFFSEDFGNLNYNNDEDNIIKLNDIFNHFAEELSKRGIELKVMIYPDKLSAYYPYLSHPEDYPKSNFFDVFNQLEKKYQYVDLFNLFRKELEKGTKDLYLFDDTHTSPISSELILKEVEW